MDTSLDPLVQLGEVGHEPALVAVGLQGRTSPVASSACWFSPEVHMEVFFLFWPQFFVISSPLTCFFYIYFFLRLTIYFFWILPLLPCYDAHDPFFLLRICEYVDSVRIFTLISKPCVITVVFFLYYSIFFSFTLLLF